jgi:D-arabinono-1,4-lactone oxidase
MYGDQLLDWRRVRGEVDPEGMFVGEWHRRYLLGEGKRLPLEEVEVGRRKLWKGGMMVLGKVEEDLEVENSMEGLSGHSSEESFDLLRASEVTVKG